MSHRSPDLDSDEQAVLDGFLGPIRARIRHDMERCTGQAADLLQVIHDHLLDHRLKVVWAKQQAGIRDNSVSLQFHGQVGQPPGAYLRARRCELAGELLRRTDWPVWRIAVLTGHASLAAFSRMFFRITGSRPTAWRRRARQARAADPPSVDPSMTAERLRAAMSGEATPAELRRILAHLLEVYLPPT